MHRVVGQIILRPEIMAADQRLAAVDRDEFGVRPGEAPAFLKGGTGAHGGHVDGEPPVRQVAQTGRQRRQQGSCVRTSGRVLPDEQANGDGPATCRQLGEAGAQGGKKACVGDGLKGSDVDAVPGARDQFVYGQQERVGMTEANIAMG